MPAEPTSGSLLEVKLAIAGEALRKMLGVLDALLAAGAVPALALDDALAARVHVVGAIRFVGVARERLTENEPEVAHCYALAAGAVSALAAEAIRRAGLSTLLELLPSPAGLQ